MVVWRTALFHPELVSAVFSICTPFQAPSEKYVPLEYIVKGPLPQFAYQLQLAGPDVEASVKSPDELKGFLNAIYGGKDANGEAAFRPETGVALEKLGSLERTVLLSEKVGIRSVRDCAVRDLTATGTRLLC